ncbi:MAG TPA: hypothetical protein VGG38_07410 [Acidimicrobiales bacterium]|jgi:DNA-directed RNA polymerase specialized sigma24 family protein
MADPVGGIGGTTSATVSAMPPTCSPIAQLKTEWRSLGRSPQAVSALHALADRDPVIARLVFGSGPTAPACRTAYDLVEVMHQASGRVQREAAAELLRILLREADAHELVPRILVQALLPGLIRVAAKLQWGRGGEWADGGDFFGDLLSTTWMTIEEWSGQDRPYAVLDLLNAVRCRLRRQLMRSKDLSQHTTTLTERHTIQLSADSETDLELLTRRLIELKSEGMPVDDIEVLYAHHVLGYTLKELAEVTGYDRRAMAARRDRGQRRLCA